MSTKRERKGAAELLRHSVEKLNEAVKAARTMGLSFGVEVVNRGVDFNDEVYVSTAVDADDQNELKVGYVNYSSFEEL